MELDVVLVTDRLGVPILTDIEGAAAIDRIAFSFADIKQFLLRNWLITRWVEQVDFLLNEVDVKEVVNGSTF